MAPERSGQPRWLDWAQSLQALAQNGLAYSTDPYEVERYEMIRSIAADIVAAHSDRDQQFVQGLFAAETGHATPKVDVRGVVFRDDGVLLVKEMRDGLWSLPGGWADVGEYPSEAVVREVYEESGFSTRPVKLLALYDRRAHGHWPPHPFQIYKLFFRCELTTDAVRTHRATAGEIEADAAAFFPENDLPELSTGRVTRSEIARFFEHYRDPQLPTDFD